MTFPGAAVASGPDAEALDRAAVAGRGGEAPPTNSPFLRVNARGRRTTRDLPRPARPDSMEDLTWR